MRAVVQRVSSASVRVDREVVGQCGPGLLVLVAAAKSDTSKEAKRLADRVFGQRIFNDESGKMNLSLTQLAESTEPNILVISNFTSLGDAWASRRPSFTNAAGYEDGKSLYEEFCAELTRLGARVQTGIFGAEMQVELINDGPVTMVVDC